MAEEVKKEKKEEKKKTKRNYDQEIDHFLYVRGSNVFPAPQVNGLLPLLEALLYMTSAWKWTFESVLFYASVL